MTPGLLVLIAVAGGAGAGLRYVVDRLAARPGGDFPRGILIVNISGSLALGLLAGLGTGVLPPDLSAVLGAGLLGGYTTFSTLAVDTVLLAQRHRRRDAVRNLVATLALAALAAGVGLALGRLLAGAAV
ncbi:fluoride efflux transporter FluC [Microbacterium aureliae]